MNKPVAWIKEDTLTYLGNYNYASITIQVQKSKSVGFDIPLYTHPHPDNLGLAESIIKQQQLKIDNLLENNARLDAEIEKLTVALRVSDDEYFKLKGMYDDCK